ncbi:MAG: terpene cyclase/mutase family protein [Planctomycetia bacterium]|nr:terpene cyclase/mutase family protein [Planctomycetia bacterium]
MGIQFIPHVSVEVYKAPAIRVFFGVFTLFLTLFLGLSPPQAVFGSEDIKNRRTTFVVSWGLDWIARHQLPDGSWNFNHILANPKQCTCANPGTYTECTHGATALAILSFLGVGMTHEDGRFQKPIRAGLKFLCASIRSDVNFPGSGSLYQEQGTMYTHGLATLCLTEAYMMTKDKRLRLPAQVTTNFIMSAQNPISGGWRYAPLREKGDISVTGLQLMVLKSAQMANFQVNPICVTKGMCFLDSVQLDDGATYGYTKPGKDPTCTAIGLLCRMYNGWDRDHPAIKKGVEYLSGLGPSSDIYYNYYATQVMRHYGGVRGQEWVNKLREQLVTSQISEEGHAKGSWNPVSEHSEYGGRLYETALSLMTLEVYYRHQPIYQSKMIENKKSK